MIRQDILEKSRAETGALVESLKPYGPRKVILFGSCATGDVNAHSDIDLCIIKNTPKRFLDRIAEVKEYMHSSFAVEPLVYTEEEFGRMRDEGNPFVMEILRTGKMLYEQE